MKCPKDKSLIQRLVIKAIFHEVIGKEGGYQILVHRPEYADGRKGKASLAKKGFRFINKEKDERQAGKTKGFYLEDLVIIKRNWGKILRALAS